MAHEALLHIAGRAGFIHGRKDHIVKVYLRTAERDDLEWPAHGGSLFLTGVDLVDQHGEVYALRRTILVGEVGRLRTHGAIRFGRIVAEHAHLDLVAVLTV